MSFCLIPEQVNKFIQGLQSGNIDPGKLANMDSSEARREYLSQFVGDENAKEVNALFESKLLLKNQQKGMIDWAKATMGEAHPRLNDIITKVTKMDKVLNSGDKQSFLEDLASKRLGVDVTFDEAKQLTDMVKSVKQSKTEIPEEAPIGSKERMTYGLQKDLLNQYVTKLKEGDKNPYPLSAKGAKKFGGDLVAATKYLASTLDNSFQLHQNIKVLLRGIADAATGNPTVLKVWSKAFIGSFSDFATELKGGDAMAANRADIMSRPNALNGKYDAMGKSVGLGVTSEEAFPQSTIAQKLDSIPILGRVFKGAEAAFNGAALKTRADLADAFIKNAERDGVDTLNKTQMTSIGKLISSMTGRGSIGKLETFGKEINTAMFSVKFLKSNWDTLTAHQFDSSMTPYAKKIAAGNLLKTVSTLAGLYALSNILNPGSANLDPTSSNFGKIQIGDNYFDPTGGMGSLVVLAARQITGKYTTTAGKTIDIGNPKYGQSSRLDVALQFFENKASPIGQVGLDFLRGQDFNGNKPTVGGEALKLVTPIPVQQFVQLRQADEDTANTVGGMILDGLGAQATIPKK